jgi:excisionase family DNA binding protein
MAIKDEDARPPLAVPLTEAPHWLGISRSAIYEEIAAGRLKGVKYGKKTLITYDSGKAWLAALPEVTLVREPEMTDEDLGLHHGH